jgi:hypothetical protein
MPFRCKSHLWCLELYTPAYSLHPKLHFHTYLIFASLLVPEIFAHFFCPHLESSFLRKWRIYVRISTILALHASKSAKICPVVSGCPFTSCWIVEKRSSFSYLGQNQKNYQQWLFCLFCAISQRFVLQLNTQFDVMGHISMHHCKMRTITFTRNILKSVSEITFHGRISHLPTFYVAFHIYVLTKNRIWGLT